MRYVLTTSVLLLPALAGAAETVEEGAKTTTPFEGTVMQAITVIVVFVLLLVVLKKMAWGPILKGLQDREQKIRRDLEDAKTTARDADATLKQYRARLAEAQAEAKAIIDQSRTDAQRIGQQIKDDTQREINQLRQRAAGDIEAAKAQALAEIHDEISGLATAVAGRIIQRELRVEDQQLLVQDALNQSRKR